jgi:hypothetical protein
VVTGRGAGGGGGAAVAAACRSVCTGRMLRQLLALLYLRESVAEAAPLRLLAKPANLASETSASNWSCPQPL